MWCDERLCEYGFRIGLDKPARRFSTREERDSALDAELAPPEEKSQQAAPLALPAPKIAGYLPAPKHYRVGCFVMATKGRRAKLGTGRIQNIADGKALVWFPSAYRVTFVELDELQYASMEAAARVMLVISRRMARRKYVVTPRVIALSGPAVKPSQNGSNGHGPAGKHIQEAMAELDHFRKNAKVSKTKRATGKQLRYLFDFSYRQWFDKITEEDIRTFCMATVKNQPEQMSQAGVSALLSYFERPESCRLVKNVLNEARAT